MAPPGNECRGLVKNAELAVAELRFAEVLLGPKQFVLAALAVVAMSGCSGDASAEPDSLRGVSERTAATLCRNFFTSAEALKEARNTANADRLDVAADGYQRLAAEARAAGARTFASDLSKAAAATHELVRSAREASASSTSPSSVGQSASLAPLMTRLMTLQLPESRMYLACYSRGLTPFEN